MTDNLAETVGLQTEDMSKLDHALCFACNEAELGMPVMLAALLGMEPPGGWLGVCGYRRSLAFGPPVDPSKPRHDVCVAYHDTGACSKGHPFEAAG